MIQSKPNFRQFHIGNYQLKQVISARIVTLKRQLKQKTNKTSVERKFISLENHWVLQGLVFRLLLFYVLINSFETNIRSVLMKFIDDKKFGGVVYMEVNGNITQEELDDLDNCSNRS